MIIAGLTTLSRLLGLVRTLVFSQTVGAGCLGTAYVTAFQVPNLIYELILGGALTSAMVPVMARAAAQADADPSQRAQVSQITSALLTWSVLLLVPVTVGLAAASGAIAALLNPANPHANCGHGDMVSVTSDILLVFAPQVLLYGLSVVLFGVLQAYRRFTAPAFAPMVSSVVLIASYLLFVPLDGGAPLARTPSAAVLVLSAGATIGVLALVLVALPPMWRLRLRLRPALRLPDGVARRVGGLAAVGVAELVVIDVSNVVVIALANGRGDTGALVLFNYAYLVFNAVYAVLALSIVTSAFPVLSSADGAAFDRTWEGSNRGVVLLSRLGTAALAAIAVPAAHVLAKQPDQVPELIAGFLLFAPGVVGIAVVAQLSRAMFALGRLKIALFALAGSWLLVIVFDVVLGLLVPSRLLVGALALGTTLGQSLVAVPLCYATRRLRGPAVLHGIGHATISGLTAAAAAAAVGVGLSVAIPFHGKALAGLVAVLTALFAVVIYGAVAWVLDKGDLRGILARISRS